MTAVPLSTNAARCFRLSTSWELLSGLNSPPPSFFSRLTLSAWPAEHHGLLWHLRTSLQPRHVEAPNSNRPTMEDSQNPTSREAGTAKGNGEPGLGCRASLLCSTAGLQWGWTVPCQFLLISPFGQVAPSLPESAEATHILLSDRPTIIFRASCFPSLMPIICFYPLNTTSYFASFTWRITKGNKNKVSKRLVRGSGRSPPK